MRNEGQLNGSGLIFMAASGLMLAHQVAGKAVRDGLFLSRFAPSDLPKVVAAAALVAVVFGLGFARILARYGPLRLVPTAFAVGAVMHIGEFAALRGANEAVRAVVVTLVYLHLVGFGAILLSGFWSITNEYFDPREAKLYFGRIAGAGTIGGVAGGLMAERGAALYGVDALLLLLAALYLGAGVVLWQVPSDRHVAKTPQPEPVWNAARDAFKQAPFLVNLAVLVLLGTMSAQLLDYLFKSGATATFGKGPELTRYFAVFYTVNQVLSFAMQYFLTPVALRRLGLGRTIQGHPASVAIGATASLFGPQTIMAPLARGLELVFRGSFLRSGYELFFTPVPPREKRAIKTFIDVGCDRMGDAFGAIILQVLLFLGPQQAVRPILLVTIVFAIVSYRITTRMDKAYLKVLEHGLLSRAVAVKETDVQDSTTLSALMRTGRFMRESGLERPAQGKATAPTSSTGPDLPVHDAVVLRLIEMRSGIPSRVAGALRPDLPYDPLLTPQAIRLLAWNEAYDWARAFLLLHGHQAVGQLVDALLDPDQDFAVRRRVPRILAYSNSQRAVDGLMSALGDNRFEIRYNASRALEFLHRMGEHLHFDQEAVMAVVERELSIPRPMWSGRKLLDKIDENGGKDWHLDDVLKGRADKSLEHVFSLLALALPAEPLKVAFRALHSEDRLLRGLGLEYLEGNLSGKIVSQLAGLVELSPHLEGPRGRQQVLDELMATQQSILMSLRIPSADVPGSDV